MHIHALSSQNLDSSFCDPFSLLPFTLKSVLQQVGRNHCWTRTLSPCPSALFSRFPLLSSPLLCSLLFSSLLGSSFFSLIFFSSLPLSHVPLNITCMLHPQFIQPQLYFLLGLPWCSCCWHVMQPVLISQAVTFPFCATFMQCYVFWKAFESSVSWWLVVCDQAGSTTGDSVTYTQRDVWLMLFALEYIWIPSDVARNMWKGKRHMLVNSALKRNALSIKSKPLSRLQCVIRIVIEKTATLANLGVAR